MKAEGIRNPSIIKVEEAKKAYGGRYDRSTMELIFSRHRKGACARKIDGCTRARNT